MRVFVYGTLTDPDRARTILDDFEFVGPATLEGCHRVDGTYPTLAPGGSVRGRLLETSEMDALDAYEGVENGLYVRVGVPLRNVESPELAELDSVTVYIGDPDALSVDDDVVWPGDSPFETRVQRYLSERAIVVRHSSDDNSTP